MSKEEIEYIGLLANVDKSILEFDFGNGIEVDFYSTGKADKVFSKIHGSSMFRNLSMKTGIINHNENRVYFLRKKFTVGSIKERFSAVNEIRNPLRERLRMIRLFKEGNIQIPIEYVIPGMKTWSGGFVQREIFQLEENESEELKSFLKDYNLPEKGSSLDLAFKNFELSYGINNNGLSLIALVTALEILLHPGDRGELRFRVSRNTAVLLGRDEKESHEIEKRIKKLYDKRSKIVHTGKAKDITRDHVREMRNYVRESIKTLLNQKKDGLIKKLNSCGFGDNPFGRK